MLPQRNNLPMTPLCETWYIEDSLSPLLDNDPKSSTLYDFEWTMYPSSSVHLTMMVDHDLKTKKEGNDSVTSEEGDHMTD